MVLGIDPLVLLAVALATLGVLGSLVPLLPGALLSLAGVYTYWFSTGYTDPGAVVLTALTAVGLLVLAVDWFGGALAAKAGGASTRLSLIAGLAGLGGLLIAGPVGLLLGSAGTVFVVEYRGTGDHRGSLRTAAYTTLGVLATTVMQTVLTFGILVATVVVILV
ncbi:DUF456 domain-containing protein [Haladaptatus sp. F3-133]|jgi:uncharacterized protein YqgC (DUF456 family)|uniref:DUF456 domain-containing protein n=1 Tax=Halorutilus salinus TaxID=2487751 RepID=A0A9Q4C2L6_9EURY|nr:DUF456 domain-containing protein [Halorutilus salinus]MCX2817916.1 DUF456 domain-containing protein [Halorutilus salinus]